MKISRNGQYALISVTDLAMHTRDSHTSLSEIAGRHKIDKGYLAQIFLILKKAGIISSIRGKGGGYFLTRLPSDITAGEVVRAAEGELAPAPCSIGDSAAQSCDSYDSCITKTIWRRIAEEINDTLDNITIEYIIEIYNKGNMEDETK